MHYPNRADPTEATATGSRQSPSGSRPLNALPEKLATGENYPDTDAARQHSDIVNDVTNGTAKRPPSIPFAAVGAVARSDSNAAKREHLEYNPQTFVAVATARYVYVGIANRADFDKINAPCRDHGEEENGHVLVKAVEGADGLVIVIFQHWLKSKTMAAISAEYREKLAAKGVPVAGAAVRP